MTGSAFERVTAALDQKTGPGRNGQWRCPAHDDTNPSLTVTAADGKVVLCCHRDCSVNDIVAALDLSMRDLFDQPAETTNGNGKVVVATYDYTDAAGALLFQKVRYSPKSFAQRRPDPDQPGRWLWKLGDTPQPLYRLPEVLAGLVADRTIFVVEGEKDADALTKAGKVATTNPGGAGKWRQEHTEVLAGATEVIVWADKDLIGWRHARDIYRALAGRVGTVRVVEGRGGGKDAADHLAAGHGPDDYGDITGVLDQRCEDLDPPDEPEVAAKQEPVVATDLFRRWTMSELLAESDTFEWLIRGMFCQPTYGQIGGEMKTLKTYLSGFIQVGLAAGVPIFDHFGVDKAQAVVSYVGEGGRVLYRRRLRRIAAAMGVNLADIPLFPSFDTAPLQSDIFRESLARDLREIGPGLVTLDPLYVYHGVTTKASDLHQEGALLSSITTPCMDAGASLSIVNHFNQTGSGVNLKRITMAGSGEWSDSWLLLSHREEPDVDAGTFKLTVDIGSRQWGGTTWELDLDIGHFDQETGQHDGDITWSLHRAHKSTVDRDQQKIIDMVAAEPFQHSREVIATGVGGQVAKMRRLIDQLTERGILKTARTATKRTNGKPYTAWTYGPAHQTPSADETQLDGDCRD